MSPQTPTTNSTNLTSEGQRLADALVKADHEFKAHPTVFHPVRRGDKTFEFRKDDRGGYHVGQTICLRCYAPETGYTDDAPLYRVITDILRPGEFGLQDGYCILSLRPLTPPEGEGSGLREAVFDLITLRSALEQAGILTVDRFDVSHLRDVPSGVDACLDKAIALIRSGKAGPARSSAALASPQPAVEGPVAAGVGPQGRKKLCFTYCGDGICTCQNRELTAEESRYVMGALLASTSEVATLTPPADPKTPDAGMGGLPPNWLGKNLATADADIARWSPGLRASFEATHGPLAQPAPAGEDETGVREALAYFLVERQHGSAAADYVREKNCGSWQSAIALADAMIAGPLARSLAPQPPKAETPAGVGDDAEQRITNLSAALSSAHRARGEQEARADAADARRVELEHDRIHPALSVDVQEHRQQAYEGGWSDGYAEGAGKLAAVQAELDAALSAAPAARPGDGVGHTVRPSDSSLYDVKCTRCGGTDASGDPRLDQPCVPAAAPEGGR